jgi:hypothetical protein
VIGREVISSSILQSRRKGKIAMKKRAGVHRRSGNDLKSQIWIVRAPGNPTHSTFR